jgi:hypothetical protein
MSEHNLIEAAPCVHPGIGVARIGAQGPIVIVRFEFKAKYSHEQLRRRHIALKK